MTDITFNLLDEGLLDDAQGFDPETGCPTMPGSSWDASLVTYDTELSEAMLQLLDEQRGLDRLADQVADEWLDEHEAAALAEQVGATFTPDDCPFEYMDGKRRFVAEGVVDALSVADDVLQLVVESGPGYVPTFRGSRDDDLREQLLKLSHLDATDRSVEDSLGRERTFSFQKELGKAQRQRLIEFDPRYHLECEEGDPMWYAVRHYRLLKAQHAERARLEFIDRRGLEKRRERRYPASVEQKRAWMGREPRPEPRRCTVHTWRAADGRRYPVGEGGSKPHLISQVRERQGVEHWPTVPLPDNPKLECWLDTQELKLRDGYWLDLVRTLRLCRLGYQRTQDQGLKRRCRRLGEQCKRRYHAFLARFPLLRHMDAPSLLLVCVAARWTGWRHTPSFAKGADVIAREVEQQLTRLRHYWLANPDPAKRAWAERKAHALKTQLA